MARTVYDRIEEVLRNAGRPLAPHEFEAVTLTITYDNDEDGWPKRADVTGRRYVGCSEATLGRRLREMAEAGRVIRKRREGKTFKEFDLARAEVQA